MENNSLLNKLNDLEARFQEVSTLITDPAVVADMKRYVRLNKEYRELEQILDARRRYIQLLTSLSEAKDILANESDQDLRRTTRTRSLRYVAVPEATRPQSSPVTFPYVHKILREQGLET